MLASTIIHQLKLVRRCTRLSPCLNPFAKAYGKEAKPEHTAEVEEAPQSIETSSKYKVFKDEESEVILDVYEEKLKYMNSLAKEELETRDIFEGINLSRGLTGVFDIEDLVEILNKENADDIFVASVPKDLNYVDYICVVTGKSRRHMKAVIQFIRRVYKQKRHHYDLIPKIEGENSVDWMALDLGNIALHVFSADARAKYDLDSLWSVGPKFDKESNREDPIVAMLEKHSIYLKDLEPAT